MKTPRRKSKAVVDTTPVTGIPVSDAKALFDAVSQDNTKTIVLGKPRVVRQDPVKAGGETELTEQAATSQPLPDGVASALLNQEAFTGELPDLPDCDLDQAFEKARLAITASIDQLIDQTELKAEDDFDALLEQSTAMMEQLIAGIDPSGPVIPGTIEMDIEQDDGTVKHHVFDNPDRLYHMAAMAQCDALIQQYDQQRLEQATKPPVKPLRLGWFSWL